MFGVPCGQCIVISIGHVFATDSDGNGIYEGGSLGNESENNQRRTLAFFKKSDKCLKVSENVNGNE